MKRIVVVGLGFVGSATAIAIANSKQKYFVNGLDLKTQNGIKRINCLNDCKFPFKTNDIKLKKALVKAVQIKKNFISSYDKSVIENADIIMVNVNFDVIAKKNKKLFDLKPFKLAIKDIASRVNFKTLTIINSTVPPGCCEKVILPIFETQFKKRKLDVKKILLAHSYERVMPGEKYYDSIINFWRVYSGINKKSEQICEKFLKSFINTKKYPLTKLQNTRSSETSKVLENTYRAVNIALIDEWTKFANEINIDLHDIIKAIKVRPTHANIMLPGIGVGGYCLTKDPGFAQIALNKIFKSQKKIDFKFAKLSLLVNEKMPKTTIDLISEKINGKFKNKRFIFFGVSYKNNVGDTRNSPVYSLCTFIKQKKGIVNYYDPYVSYWEEFDQKSLKIIPNLTKYDCIIFSVNHTSFNTLNFKKLNLNKKTMIFDIANVITEKKQKMFKLNNENYIRLGR